MGKGDVKTKKGKIFRNSYGNIRRRKKQSNHFNWATKRIRIIDPKEKLKPSSINQVVFPILTMKDEEFIPLGTGFFINRWGWFITAAHVVITDYDKDNESHRVINPGIVVEIIDSQKGKHKIREIRKIWQHPTSDIAIGKLVSRRGEVENSALPIKINLLKKNQEIFGYGYPKTTTNKPIGRIQGVNLSPEYKFGRIIDIQDRKSGKVSGKVYYTNMDIDSGSSGGPVMDNNGNVIAINNISMDLMKGEAPLSTVVSIHDAFDILVPITRNGKTEIMKFYEIIEQGGAITDKME